ncbi:MAG: histidine kinase [Clostridiales bacterium]|nr:histidine kinase [Clostridiales bacterium]
MTSKIFRSVFFTSVLTLLASLVLVLGVLFGAFENQIEKELKSEAGYIAYTIENGDMDFFNRFSDSGKRVTLIDPNGEVIADTEADAGKMDNHSDREEVKEALKDGSGTNVRYSKTLTEKTVYYAQRLSNGTVLRVSTTQYTIITIILGLLQPLIFVLVIAMALSLFLSSKVSKRLVKPINSIDLDNPENCDTYDELSPLLHKIINQNRTIARQIEKARQVQEEFRLITENMSEGFLVIDKNTKILSYNSAALKLLDAEKAEDNVLTLNRTSGFIDAVTTALDGRRAENAMLHGDRTYNLIANPVFNSGEVIGAVIVIIDVTETAKREAMRREFTANVSHELKTPLTSISGFAELMKAGGIPEETVVDFSTSIYTEAQRLITLVTDIIKISELDEKSDRHDWEKVNLYELSRDVIKRLKISAEKKNVSFTLNGGDAEVYGVRQILDEMVYNLCDNAIKYNKEGGRVSVSVKDSDKGVTLSVSDTGIGIPQTQQSRIFERFYRVDKSRSKAEGGTGLGLSIVKHGAIYHNAEISVESEIGKGTKMTILFKK